MKHFLKTMALAAGLTLALTAAGQAHAQRFRYLGTAGGLSILASDATGPSNARAFSLVMAVAGRTGPKGSDTFIAKASIDCGAGTIQLLSVAAFAGETALPIENNPATPEKIEANTPFRDIQDFICDGLARDEKPVWIEGPDKARAYARDRARESQ